MDTKSQRSADRRHVMRVIAIGHKQHRLTLDYCRQHGLQATATYWLKVGRAQSDIAVVGSVDELLAFAEWSNARFDRLNLGAGDIQDIAVPETGGLALHESHLFSGESLNGLGFATFDELGLWCCG